MGNEIKIIIGGDASSLIQANNQANASVEALEKTIVAASSKIDAATNSIVHSFDEVAAGKAAMDRISAAIDAAADAATKAGPKFDSLGGRFPLADMNAFRASVQTLKNDLNKGFSPTIEAGFSKISQGAGQASVALSKVKPGANQAGNALTNLGRVAQDLPFGFVGIQNNLNPLLESFQRLKAETGSGKEALKALGSSLVGAGGIGLALSAVSAAITLSTVGFGAWTRGFKGADEAIDKTKKEIDEFIKSIRSIGLIQQEATAGVEGQITQVTALAQVVSDSNKPYAERKRALEELKDVNKSYFGDLKLEDAATGALTKTVDEYTKALINNAIQKGFVDEIASVAKEIAKQDDIIAKARLKVAQAQTKVNEAQQRTKESFTEEQISANAAAGAAAIDNLKEAQAELGKENAKVTELLVQEALVRGQLNKAVEVGLKFKDLDTKGNKKDEDTLKKRIEALKELQSLTGLDLAQRIELSQLEVQLTRRDAVKLAFKPNEVKEAAQAKIDAIFPKEFGNFTVRTKFFIEPEFSKVQKPEILSKDQVGDIAKATGNQTIELQSPNFIFLNIKDKVKAALEQLNKEVQSISTGAMEAFAAGLGDAIAGKGDIFSSLFTLLADGLQQLGKALLAYGLALVGFKVALNSLNPVVALAAGALAIAAGAALKAAVPKFADGGIATKATLGIFGEAGKEAIIPLDKLPSLLGRLNIDNQNDVMLAPTFRVSLTDLELGLERVRSKRRRLG